jgi:hypothetical protein
MVSPMANNPKVPVEIIYVDDAHAQLKQCLEEEGHVSILVAPDEPGVILPLHLMREESVKLNLSYRFKGSNMVFDEDAFRVSLTFKGVEFRCQLPWSCFIAIAPFESPKPEEVRKGFRIVK